MERTIDISNNKVLKTGFLKKSGEEFAIVLLAPKDIPQMLALQQLILDALPVKQKNFMHKKSPQFMERHFKLGNIALGVVHEGQLIAQSIIVNPSHFQSDIGMSDLRMDVRPEKVTVIEGVIVDPAFRGNNLMTHMVDEWLAIAKEQKRTHALAEVTVQNHHSWSVFMKEGLYIHSIGFDRSDCSNVYNMHAPVSQLIKARAKPDFNKAAKKSAVVNMNQLRAQKALLNQGYVGVSFDAANNNIAFRAPRKKRPQGPKVS